MKRTTCFLSGRVQGVGMRFTVHEWARRFPLTGYVTNLDDGRVQIVLEGSDADIDAFLVALRDHAPGHIHRMERYDSEASGEFSIFRIER
jgi:acylphosphatase